MGQTIGGASEARTVLLAEDDPMLRDVLVATLSADGWRVIAVDNGAEALRALDAERPAVILSDRMMPEMSGYEFLETLRRERPDLVDVPFVFLTALDDRRDMMAAAALAPAAYLTKPVRPRELRATLAALLDGPDEAPA